MLFLIYFCLVRIWLQNLSFSLAKANVNRERSFPLYGKRQRTLRAGIRWWVILDCSHKQHIFLMRRALACVHLHTWLKCLSHTQLKAASTSNGKQAIVHLDYISDNQFFYASIQEKSVIHSYVILSLEINYICFYFVILVKQFSGM